MVLDPKESAFIASAMMVALEAKHHWKNPSPDKFGLTEQQYTQFLEVCQSVGPNTSLDYMQGLILKYTEGATKHA